jgi:hypothetical protein
MWKELKVYSLPLLGIIPDIPAALSRSSAGKEGFFSIVFICREKAVLKKQGKYRNKAHFIKKANANSINLQPV